MTTGKVKWFDERKGFGFIQSDDGKDVFVHLNDLKSSGINNLHEGQLVTFDIMQDQKGPSAKNIQLR